MCWLCGKGLHRCSTTCMNSQWRENPVVWVTCKEINNYWAETLCFGLNMKCHPQAHVECSISSWCQCFGKFRNVQK
jgi:hypothetical protein